MSDRQLFTPLNDDGLPFVAFLLQQFFVPFASLVTLFIIPEMPWEHTGAKGAHMEVARCIIMSAFVGFALGNLVSWEFPKMRAAGKWIGAIPAILITGALVSDAHTFTLTTALTELFFPGPDGEQWWAFILFSCPTISSLCYSAAMLWPLLPRQPRAKH